MSAKDTDRPEWRLAGDLDNAATVDVLRNAEVGKHYFLWLGDRLFVFKCTVAREGDEIMLELVEGARIRRDDHLPEGTVCFADPYKRAGYRETFVWRNVNHYEDPDVGLRPDVERLFFEGFMGRARDKFL